MKNLNVIINKDDVSKAKREAIWDTLIDQIVKGNVIPVIGREMVKINGVPSDHFLLNIIVENGFEINEELPSFTALMNHPKCSSPTVVYKLVSRVITNNPHLFEPTVFLESFLSIKYFPFVITTTIDPVIENTMRKIHGEKLRVLSFDNDPQSNDDIRNSCDISTPTLYYMFGKANERAETYVLSDTDLLCFSRSWLLPKDSSNFSKPANLSSALSNKYLLVLGNNFQDWLFRFFWFAMKDKKLNGKTDIPNGMDTSRHSDRQLIEFLNFSNITSQISELSDFITELKKRIEKLELQSNKNTILFGAPIMDTDVFISYSRADSYIVEKLYYILKKRGLKVWYDKKNLGLADDFRSEIRRAIRTSSLFVPVLSHHITEQATDEHIYRLEWQWAIEHKRMVSSAIPYIAPLTEKGFDLNDKLADIPEDIKDYNAFSFDNDSSDCNLETFADKLFELLKFK